MVGAGTMGAGIAQCALVAGCEVTLWCRRDERACELPAVMEQALGKQVARGKLDGASVPDLLSHLAVTTDLASLAACDVVLESVAEDLATKKALFSDLGAVCRPDAVLATNTSTLPVVDLAMQAGRPERVVGMHFFNPAWAMSLVEIARPITASAEAVAAACAFAGSLGKRCVEVEDRAGFVVNALLFRYLNGAVRLLEEGRASMQDVDAAMTLGCNFPMGPFSLLDLVGLDVSVSILDALHSEDCDQASSAAPTLRRLVAAGRLGRKSGRGFYDYTGPVAGNHTGPVAGKQR